MHALTIAKGWGPSASHVSTIALGRPRQTAVALAPRGLSGRRQGRARLRRLVPILGGSRTGRRPSPARGGGGAAGGS